MDKNYVRARGRFSDLKKNPGGPYFLELKNRKKRDANDDQRR